MQVIYTPDESQVVTCGSDKKIASWEVFDGRLIRDLEGSASGSILGLDGSRDGKIIVSGGQDKLVKVCSILPSVMLCWFLLCISLSCQVWKYKEGEVAFVGANHSGDVTSIKICPSQKYIITTSSDGAIFRWSYPL